MGLIFVPDDVSYDFLTGPQRDKTKTSGQASKKWPHFRYTFSGRVKKAPEQQKNAKNSSIVEIRTLL